MMPVLYAFTLLHGIFAAGVIPILGALIPGRAAWAFGAYFAGLVGGVGCSVGWGVTPGDWATTSSQPVSRVPGSVASDG